MPTNVIIAPIIVTTVPICVRAVATAAVVTIIPSATSEPVTESNSPHAF